MTPRTVACKTALSMGFSRQEYWSGLPFPSPGDLPHPGIESWFPASQAESSPFELQVKSFSIFYECILNFFPLKFRVNTKRLLIDAAS